MNALSLHAISPIDGRYRNTVEVLAEYFSEYALMRERCRIEVEYFIALASMGFKQLPPLNQAQQAVLRRLYTNFGDAEAQQIKEIEEHTNHDVKAVEYFIKEKLEASGLSRYVEWVHFGLTSQDINNTAIPILTRNALAEHLQPVLEGLLTTLRKFAADWQDAPMLSYTHGQPASPTTMGKEIAVFVERIDLQYNAWKDIMYYGKFGGATGSFNAHKAAFPEVNWPSFADKFLDSLGLVREQTTTQIDHYDHLAALFHGWMRINTILIDFCRDIWSYISMEYLSQKAVKGETGSSTMPHKVNPIDFENAEGNLGLANALFGHLAAKLPVSRLQRDLTDSTVLRNIGVPFAHTFLAITSLRKGLNKIVLNRDKLAKDLDSHWIVLSEAIQTILRREGIPTPYELLKDLTRDTGAISKEMLWQFIDGLQIDPSVKEELKQLTPQKYIGFA